MRVRVLQDFSTANESFHAGEVREIDPRKADAWLRRGLVMEDKSQDGGRETKAEVQPQRVTRKRTRK